MSWMLIPFLSGPVKSRPGKTSPAERRWDIVISGEVEALEAPWISDGRGQTEYKGTVEVDEFLTVEAFGVVGDGDEAAFSLILTTLL